MNDHGSKPRGLGKYSSLNLHDGIAEFRLFQSTLHLPSFMKNLEFIWALIEWTNLKSATGAVWQHDKFIAWLGKLHGAETRYPYLFAFLRKPSYSGIGFDSIKNVWGHLIPPQTTKSLDVVTGDADRRLAA